MPATKVEICNRNKKDILWRYIHVKWRQYWVSCSNPLAYLVPTILKLFGFCNLLSVRDEGYSRISSYVLISISTFYYGRHVDLLRHIILGQAVFVITPDTWSWVRQSFSLLLTHDPGSGSLCHYSWHMILGQAVFVITPDTWSWVRQSLSLLLTHDPWSGSLCHYSWHMILGQAVFVIFVITPDTWSWVRQSLSLLLTHDPGSCSLCHYSWRMILGQTVFVITPDTWSWVRKSLSLLLTHDPG